MRDPLTRKDKIVAQNQVRPYAPRGTAADAQQAEYVTEVFHLQHIAPEQAENYIKTFFPSPSTGNQSSGLVSTIPEARLLIVTDLALNLEKIEDLIEKLDRPSSEITHIFREVKHLEADTLKTQVDEIISSILGVERADGTGPAAPAAPDSTSEAAKVRVSVDTRTNRLLLIGTKDQIDRIMPLIDELDVPLDVSVVTYSFQREFGWAIGGLKAGPLDLPSRRSGFPVSGDSACRENQRQPPISDRIPGRHRLPRTP